MVAPQKKSTNSGNSVNSNLESVKDPVNKPVENSNNEIRGPKKQPNEKMNQKPLNGKRVSLSEYPKKRSYPSQDYQKDNFKKRGKNRREETVSSSYGSFDSSSWDGSELEELESSHYAGGSYEEETRGRKTKHSSLKGRKMRRRYSSSDDWNESRPSQIIPPTPLELQAYVPKIELKKLAAENNAALAVVDNLGILYRLKDHEKRSLVVLSLDKQLLSWFHRSALDSKGWFFKNKYESFKTALKEYIMSKELLPNSANRQILHLKQTGLIKKYGEKFSKLLDQVTPSLREPSVALELYRSNLSNAMYSRFIDVQVLNWSELHEYCEEHERVFQREKQ